MRPSKCVNVYILGAPARSEAEVFVSGRIVGLLAGPGSPLLQGKPGSALSFIPVARRMPNSAGALIHNM